MDKTFREELCDLLNKYSKESPSNTPDFILADYIGDCLEAYDKAVTNSRHWHSGTGPYQLMPDWVKDVKNRQDTNEVA